MNGNTFLIPANSKRGMLILGIFRPIDLIIFCIGIGLTIVFIVIISPETLFQTFIVLFPAGLATVLIAPIPNYHNVLVFILSMINFFISRQKYVWKGWCFNERTIIEDEKQV